MQYYQDLITNKSFLALATLKKQFNFILIGGWAVFLYTQSLKSKDIDIVAEYDVLSDLNNKFTINKNERLKKYEINLGEIDIDIYLPHYSALGVPVEEIKKYCQIIDGFTVPQIEVLLILKQTAYLERQGSPKGEKDKIDIISLASRLNFNFKSYQKLLAIYHLKNRQQELLELIKSINELAVLGMNQYKYSKFKKQVLAALG